MSLSNNAQACVVGRERARWSEAEYLVGNVPSVLQWQDSSPEPPHPFLAFPRELIIKVAGDLEEGRHSIQSGYSQPSAENRMLPQSAVNPLALANSCLPTSVALEIQTSLNPSFSALPARMELSESICTTRHHNW